MLKHTTKSSTKTSTNQLTLIGLLAAVICIVSPFSVPLPFSPVPLSFSTFAICLAAYLLGMKNGTICVILY
ncbi:MAG: biotin transporter BioY, partial [Brevinema sp.]